MDRNSETELTVGKLFNTDEGNADDWQHGLMAQTYTILTKCQFSKGEDHPAAGRSRIGSVEVGPVGMERLTPGSDGPGSGMSSAKVNGEVPAVRPQSNEKASTDLPCALPTIELTNGVISPSPTRTKATVPKVKEFVPQRIIEPHKR